MSQPMSQGPPPYSANPNYGSMSNEKGPYQTADSAQVAGQPGVTYAPQQQVPPYVNQATTTIITTQPSQPIVYRFGQYPMSLNCPLCNAHIVTAIHYENGAGVWLVAGVMCLLGLWLGCCLIPFCINGVKDVHHTCPNCNRMIGVFRRV